MQTTTHTPTPLPVPPREHHTLDTLSRRTFDELATLYRNASAPTSLRAADGALRGRMLAVKSLPSPLASALRRFAASPSFVWEGKTFQATSDTAGEGHNRIALSGVLGRQNLFPFTTRLDRSELDTLPTLVLDYDHAFNPPYIRRVHDEIRELSPRLFLGPAMWKTRRGPTTVLWFALDGRAS